MKSPFSTRLAIQEAVELGPVDPSILNSYKQLVQDRGLSAGRALMFLELSHDGELTDLDRHHGLFNHVPESSKACILTYSAIPLDNIGQTLAQKVVVPGRFALLADCESTIVLAGRPQRAVGLHSDRRPAAIVTDQIPTTLLKGVFEVNGLYFRAIRYMRRKSAPKHEGADIADLGLTTELLDRAARYDETTDTYALPKGVTAYPVQLNTLTLLHTSTPHTPSVNLSDQPVERTFIRLSLFDYVNPGQAVRLQVH